MSTNPPALNADLKESKLAFDMPIKFVVSIKNSTYSSTRDLESRDQLFGHFVPIVFVGIIYDSGKHFMNTNFNHEEVSNIIFKLKISV
jgi:hypothetical protein